MAGWAIVISVTGFAFVFFVVIALQKKSETLLNLQEERKLIHAGRMAFQRMKTQLEEEKQSLEERERNITERIQKEKQFLKAQKERLEEQERYITEREDQLSESNRLVTEKIKRCRSLISQLKKDQEAVAITKRIAEEQFEAIPYLARIHEDFVETRLIESTSEKILRSTTNCRNTIAELRREIAALEGQLLEARYKYIYYEAQEKRLQADKESFDLLVEEKLKLVPSLREIWKAYERLQDKQLLLSLRPTIQNFTQRDIVERLIREKQELIDRAAAAEEQLYYYQSVFPSLLGDSAEDPEEIQLLAEQLNNPPEEHALDDAESDDARWLPREEYRLLNRRERAELAFERYKRRHRTRWEIGRDYERYIGYLYERSGFEVEYHGIMHGRADLGRDLICKKPDEIAIVQCKYWSQRKQIRENHVNQLFGTALAYAAQFREQDNLFEKSIWDTMKQKNIKAVLVTSTVISDEARKIAELLQMEVWEKEKLADYPMIKCNVNRTNGERIYHMPYDQMYDNTRIEPKRGEFYAMTVEEAEAKGFRRALRHYYN